jgi:hypothetical protein
MCNLARLWAANAHSRWSQLKPRVRCPPLRKSHGGPVRSAHASPETTRSSRRSVRASDSNDRLEQRRDSSHLCGLADVRINTGLSTAARVKPLQRQWSAANASRAHFTPSRQASRRQPMPRCTVVRATRVPTRIGIPRSLAIAVGGPAGTLILANPRPKLLPPALSYRAARGTPRTDLQPGYCPLRAMISR